MTTYDNFAQTFSQSRKNMKWEEIEYFLTKYAPFGDVLDVGCGNGRLLGELIYVIPAQAGIYKKEKNILKDSVINTEGHVYTSYLGIDSSEKLLEEANKSYLVMPTKAGIYKKEKTIILSGEGQTGFSFQYLDMRDISSLPKKSFDTIFLIASFHHLEKSEERLQVLQDAKNLLKIGGKIFMTNWALESDLNKEKYKNSKIQGSENEFGGTDFQIKIGEFQRYYHSFTLGELESISKKAGFEIIENRLFETERNFVTILQKKEQ